jgi:hypothetical protein
MQPPASSSTAIQRKSSAPIVSPTGSSSPFDFGTISKPQASQQPEAYNAVFPPLNAKGLPVTKQPQQPPQHHYVQQHSHTPTQQVAHNNMNDIFDFPHDLSSEFPSDLNEVENSEQQNDYLPSSLYNPNVWVNGNNALFPSPSSFSPSPFASGFHQSEVRHPSFALRYLLI